jgi:hypothetical protein
MPVWKYRRIEDMPEVWKMKRGTPLGPRIRAVLSLSRIAPSLEIPRGVTRFHSFEELAADRRKYESARIARIRALRERKP